MQAKVRSIVLPGEGRELSYGPNRMAIKVGPETGSQQMTILEGSMPPQSGVFPHRHLRFEESFYTLEGEIEFRYNDEHVVVPPGSHVLIPVGVVHAFKNVGTGSARMLIIHSTPDAVAMIEELGHTRPDQFGEVMAKYDSEPVR